MTDDTYTTISAPTEGLYKSKGSKFLAFAFPVLSEDEAKKHIARLKKQYHDARHHCFAWRFGPNGEQYRAFDDGEPSGTAGKPILGQLLSFGYTNIVLVVVRYFGGTLLGTGGLAEAYKLSAKDALDNAIPSQKYMETEYLLRCTYDKMGVLMNLIKEFDMSTVKQTMELEVEIVAGIRLSCERSFLDKVEPLNFLSVKRL